MRLLTVGETARLLKVRPQRVYEVIKQGLLPAAHLGRQIRVEEGVLEAWIKAGGQALPGGWRRAVG